MEKIQEIATKVLLEQRIDASEALLLYKKASLSLLAYLADELNIAKNKNHVYYNKNLHIEPTNKCVYQCKFCSYYAYSKEDAWEYSVEEMIKQIQAKKEGITEVHIVGGVHPLWKLKDYTKILFEVRKTFPLIHIKAFSAVEIAYMAKQENISFTQCLGKLKECGLDSIPGGGAEIFHQEIREQICPEKLKGKEWIKLHRDAHNLGISSNATILYGHIEEKEHIIHHLSCIRDLQDETSGFKSFVPLKYKAANNELSGLGEVSVVDDLRMFAISRIFLDNFQHIKAYWPMLGRKTAAISLHFGVNDLDGTVQDSTKIYSRAGQEEKQNMTVAEIQALISKENKIPCERDSLYKPIP